jgi:membrane-bound metal-dependent hydrolase YbcI (DUF457 family)
MSNMAHTFRMRSTVIFSGIFSHSEYDCWVMCNFFAMYSWLNPRVALMARIFSERVGLLLAFILVSFAVQSKYYTTILDSNSQYFIV